MQTTLVHSICENGTYTGWTYFDNRKKRKRRLWSRVNTGFEKFWVLRRPLYWMVLTSWLGSGSKREGGSFNRDMTYSFKKLQQRLKRRGKFEYIKIHVPSETEGGVLHVIYTGTYIHHAELMRLWYEIHGAYIVWIDKIQMTFGSIAKVVNYLVGYLNHHYDSRMSWSGGWLYRGAIADMKKFIKEYGYRYGIVLYKQKVLIEGQKCGTKQRNISEFTNIQTPITS